MFLLLCKAHVEEATPLIQSTDALHFLCCQFKIKNVDIVLNMLRIRRFREYNRSLLNMPTQDDLHIVFTIFISIPFASLRHKTL